MTEFQADRESGLPVHLALLRRQVFGSLSTGCRCRPSGEFPVPDLGVLVSMPVDAVDACRCALMSETTELVDIVTVSRDEAAPDGQ